MQRFRFDAWGSLNQEVEPEYLEQGELVECENVDLSVTGKIKPAIENSIKLNTGTEFDSLSNVNIPKYLTCLESPSEWTPDVWGENNYDYILFFKKNLHVCFTGLNKNTKDLDADMPDTVHELYESSSTASLSISKIGDSYIIVDGGSNKKWADDTLIGIGLDYSGSESVEDQIKPPLFQLKSPSSTNYGDPEQKWLCIHAHENEEPIVGFDWSTQALAFEALPTHSWRLPWAMAFADLGSSNYELYHFYKANLFHSATDTEILENIELSGSSWGDTSKWYYETIWLETYPTYWWPVWNIETGILYPSGTENWWNDHNIDTNTPNGGDAVARNWSNISAGDDMNGYWYIEDNENAGEYFLMFYSGHESYPTFSSLDIGVDSIPDPSSIWRKAMEMNIWKFYWGTPYTNHLPKHSYSIEPIEDSVTSIYGPDFDGYYEFSASLESLFSIYGAEESNMFNDTIELSNDLAAIDSDDTLIRMIDGELWSQLWPKPTSRTYASAGVIPHDFVDPGKVYAVRYIYRTDNIDTMLTPLIYLNDENASGFHEGLELTAGSIVKITIQLCIQSMIAEGSPENVYCQVYRGDSDGDLYDLETIPIAATVSDLSSTPIVTHLDYYDTSADANLSTTLDAADYSAIAPPANSIASEYVADQLYLAKGAKLHWSDYGVPEQFSELHTTLFDENITALENIGGNLAVIMPGSINVYRPIDEIGVIQKSLSEVGCESDSKTANSKSLVFLINNDALWGFDGIRSRKMSTKAKTYYNNIINNGSNILIEANIMSLYIAYTDQADNCRTLKLSASGKNRWGLIDPGIQVHGLCSTPDNRIIACGVKSSEAVWVEAFSSIEGGVNRTSETYKVVSGVMRFLDGVALRGLSAMSKHFVGTEGTTITVIAKSLVDTVNSVSRSLSGSGEWFRDRFNIKTTFGRVKTVQVEIEGNKSDVKEIIVEVSGNGPTASSK